MKKMTSGERIKKTFEHKEVDRIPFCDSVWTATVERWIREGMPEQMDWRDYFDLDKVQGIGVDNSPRFEKKVIKETDEYIIVKNQWGATFKDFKHSASVPEFLDFEITTRKKWQEAKKE